ncbi:MAG: aspartate/glutamate racemase family protein [Tateyamaria sp.]
MSIVIINPNSTASMTDAMLQMAEQAAPDLDFAGWTSHAGPPAIQGAEDGEAATAPLLDLVAQADAQGAGGIIIGCFDDTALARAAALASCPVIGIGQAAFHYAALRGWRFSVVTTLDVSIPVIENNIAELGLAGQVARVRASDVPVLDLEHHPDASSARILREAQRAQSEDGVDAIVLGCAGMVTLSAVVRDTLDLPVIDPVIAAATCMRWLC